MTDRLKEMQELRSAGERRALNFGEILKRLSHLCIKADEPIFGELSDMIMEYGRGHEQYGYWNGAIAERLGVSETPSEKEAREYAAAAAAAGQIELGFRDPDDKYNSIERSGTG